MQWVTAWVGFPGLPEFGCASTWCPSMCVKPSSLPRGSEKRCIAMEGLGVKVCNEVKQFGYLRPGTCGTFLVKKRVWDSTFPAFSLAVCVRVQPGQIPLLV